MRSASVALTLKSSSAGLGCGVGREMRGVDSSRGKPGFRICECHRLSRPFS